MREIFICFLLLLAIASNTLAETSATIDPMDIGVGTRALGMGKSYVGVADDANCIFLNPAGLASLHNWGLTSMYTSLISEITYNSLGIYTSRGDEAFAMGYVGANITGTIYNTYRDPVSKRIVPMNVYSAGYTNSVLLFSYGFLAGKYTDTPYIKDTSFGVSFKSFFQTLRSSEELSASGFNMDLGMIYPFNSWLKLGIYAQNILPESAGGVLRWDSGEKESIPSNYKLGLSFKALGKDARWDYSQDLFLNLDMEQGAVMNRPTVWHGGVEWWPYSFAAIRCGIDQDVYSRSSGNGVDNNITFGLGLWYGEVGFDYAYHQYGPLTDNITHYFSLSYGNPRGIIAPITEKKPAVEKPKEPEIKDFLKISAPVDRSIIYSDSVDVNGEIQKDIVDRIEVNGTIPALMQTETQKEGVFSVNLPIENYGKFPITVQCFDKQGNVLKEYKLTMIRLASFSDVGEGYWAKKPIEDLASFGFIGGFPDHTFKPDKTINRAELTAMLIRATGIDAPPVKKDVFKDVGKNHWAAKYIKLGVDREVVTGYRDQTFKPSNALNRTEGLLMIARFAGIKPPAVLRENPFPDVPASHWAAKMIYAAREAGLLDYLKDKTFEPNKPLTRAEAAEMLSRTPYAKGKTAQLYD